MLPVLSVNDQLFSKSAAKVLIFIQIRTTKPNLFP